MTTARGIHSIDLDNEWVTLLDGTVLPISDYFDEYGEDCEPEEAVVIVAGTDELGWVSVPIDEIDWEGVTYH